MIEVQAGGATGVPISLEEMDKVIARGFRACSPKKMVGRSGEYWYILTPDDDQPMYVIRVQSSIFRGNEMSRETGEDSIRIILLNEKTDRPITGKFSRVHRTQNWKDNLRSRIEDAVEEFEDMNEDRREEIKMLQALVAANAHDAFKGMLTQLQEGKFFQLTEKQKSWVEGSYSRLRG